eukprot:TRINITY_DN70947_c0_g1_i1.p1 TRINITY_DN70947_c0_g1~~TRINITY_DN70947_c0_g1_i1.p1  ORF type:complete len:181 (+),score=10.46 TRINITY_DN70947_c0_g1_i1:91-633(+)
MALSGATGRPALQTADANTTPDDGTASEILRLASSRNAFLDAVGAEALSKFSASLFQRDLGFFITSPETGLWHVTFWKIFPSDHDRCVTVVFDTSARSVHFLAENMLPQHHRFHFSPRIVDAFTAHGFSFPVVIATRSDIASRVSEVTASDAFAQTRIARWRDTLGEVAPQVAGNLCLAA